MVVEAFNNGDYKWLAEQSFGRAVAKDKPAIVAGRVPDWEKDFKRRVGKMSHEALCRQYLGVWVIPEEVESKELALEPTVISRAFTAMNSNNIYFMCSIGFNSDYSKAYVSMFDGKVIRGM